MLFRKLILARTKVLLSLVLLLPLSAFAHLISISATIPFPTSVTPGSTKFATYTVTNTTSQANVTIVDESQFPSGSGLSIVQNASTCPGRLLTPGSTCTIQLKLMTPTTAQTISTALREWAQPSADGVQYPINVTVSSSLTNTFAYISNLGTAPESISLCLVDANTGLLSNCGTAVSINGAAGVTIFGNFAYIGDEGATNLVHVCSINASTGALSNCTATGSTFNGPYGVALSPTGSFAYTANNGNSTVSVCSVDPVSGLFSNCAPTGSGFATPQGITINPSNSFAYISNNGGNSVSVCSINSSTGGLSNCTVTGSGFNGPWGIMVNATGTFAYVANNNNNTVSVCAVDANTGALSSCTISAGSFSGPSGIALNAAGTLAYVANENTNTISVCTVTASTGTLSGCTVSGSGFNLPSGVGLY